MRYKILFISSWFPNKLESTNGNFVQRHAEAVSLLHDVEILHSIGVPDQKERYVLDDSVINGIRTLIVYYRKSRNPIENFITRMKAYKKGFKMLTKPDLVHGNVLQNNMLFALRLKTRYGIPYVISEHWSGLQKRNRSSLSASKLMIAKTIAAKADYILPVSHMLKNEMQDAAIGKKYEVVENVVDTELFYPLNDKSNLPFVFLHISSLLSLKNPDKIISAAARLHSEFPNFQLHIGGDGDVEKLNLEVQKHQADSYIFTFGEQSITEVAEKMRNSHCFVLFSEYENLPCVLLESMSSGTPVIATNVGGVPEIVTKDYGFVIEKSEEELYQAMKKILENKMSFSSPDSLHHYIDSNFSKQKIAEKFDKVYQKVVKK